MKQTSDKHTYSYNYGNKCDCSDDDNCGCDFPNNIAHNFENHNQTAHQNLILSKQAFIGHPAPDFTARALLSNNTFVESFNLYRYTQGHITVLFFYPEDFSFTCPSELLMLNQELNAFNRRGAKILAISTDSIYTHIAWKELPPSKDGIADVSFPLIADENKIITKTYGVLDKKEVAARATFILDEQHIIRHIAINDNKVWRNPTEIIRIIDILNYKGDGYTNCPPGWKQNFAHERPEQQTLSEMYSKTQ